MYDETKYRKHRGIKLWNKINKRAEDTKGCQVTVMVIGPVTKLCLGPEFP